MTANVLRGEKRRSGFLAWAALLVLLPLGITNAFAQLRGHGGPVRALAIWSDGETAVSGSFDSTAIRWSLTRNAAVQVLRFHTDAVNAVVTLRDGRAATAGTDGKIAIWSLGRAEPDSVLEGHTAPIAALAISPDGATLASASWDQTLRLWPLAGGAPRVLTGHTQNVNGVAFAPDGALVAAASVGGAVAVIDRKTRALMRTLVGPGLPVRSVAFMPDSRILLTGGADDIIRRWNALTGDPIDPLLQEAAGDPLAAYAGDRGAEIFRACVACHTLGVEQSNRAGPTLANLFGRKIATLPGYNFSEALKRLDIVWTPETVSRLFEIGPAAYTPGTKMPEQRIGSEQDRAA